jgi:hypothetical protein
VINHCDRNITQHDKINPFDRIITHLGEMDISFVLNNINDISVVLFNIPSRGRITRGSYIPRFIFQDYKYYSLDVKELETSI